MKILIVEDERELLNSLEKAFREEHVMVEQACDLEMALEKVALYEYDVVLLDLGLPGGSGLEVLQQLKALHPETGVIIVSAANALSDKIQGLDMGADDYLTKPFHFAELNARVKSLLRRRQAKGALSFEWGPFQLEPETLVARVKGKLLDLTPKEFEILHFFVVNPGRVISKVALAEKVWGDYADTFDDHDFIYTHIRNLRKKIVAFGVPDPIKTVYGLGYKFECI